MFNDIYRGKKVLVTGHCGFKGSWLCLWLKKLGADVIGYGRPPNTKPSHYDLLLTEYDRGIDWGIDGDLRHFEFLRDIIRYQRPDLVIHLAAKAIVARTFDDPRGTLENNIMGAVNILEACRQTHPFGENSIKGIVMITTDKVYENREWSYAYRECDALGGVDPYSASKVCIEQVIRCYREAFGMKIAVARAGNVIGGGDWSYKRLIPDMMRAVSQKQPVIVHTPNATRPFQHVLDALQGYLLLGQKILETPCQVNQEWNFGPTEELSVLQVLSIARDVWPDIEWKLDTSPTHPFMQYRLKIDSSESRLLGWKPVWGIREAVINTIGWYMAYYMDNEVLSGQQIEQYEEEYHA